MHTSEAAREFCNRCGLPVGGVVEEEAAKMIGEEAQNCATRLGVSIQGQVPDSMEMLMAWFEEGRNRIELTSSDIAGHRIPWTWATALGMESARPSVVCGSLAGVTERMARLLSAAHAYEVDHAMMAVFQVDVPSGNIQLDWYKHGGHDLELNKTKGPSIEDLWMEVRANGR